MKKIFLLLTVFLMSLSCSNPEIETKKIQFIKVELGGCNIDNTNEEQKINIIQENYDTVICRFINDTLVINVGINYICCASMQAISEIKNDTLLLLISDTTETASEYCRCTCFYTFDYYFANCKDKEYVIKVLFDSQKNETEAVTIPATNFDYRNCGCSMNITNMQHDSVYVINSEKEFANYFTCENNPPIDFTTKTLLVAFGGTTNGIKDISTELLAENSTEYLLTVDVKLTPAAVAQKWYIALIADKINPFEINLNVNKHF